MDADLFPEADVEAPTVDAATLRARMDDGEPLFVLDTRAPNEFEEWHLEGESLDVANVPYFDLLEGIDEETLALVPDDRPVVVLCAKGGYDVSHLEGGMNAWAELYEAEEVSRYDGPGTLVQYRRPSSGCLSYLVHDGEVGAVVDPLRAFADRYVEDAEALGVDLRYAFDTHVHADHVSGARSLADHGVEPVVPAPAADRGIEDVDAFTTATDGDAFEVGDVTVEALHAPGHTTGMTAYRVGGAALMTGDGLFVESVARPDLEAGDDGAPEAAEALYASLQSVVLPHDDDVVVGGAHYSDAAEPAADGTYTATIGELRADMDALSMDREDFVDLILADMPPRPANFETIIETNLGKASPDDEEAFQLELGPNNCAASQDAMTGD